MPFTPFHLGVGLVAKAGLDVRLSLVSFSVAQVLIDVEPGVRMLLGVSELHGRSHTLAGAVLVGIVATAVSQWLIKPLVSRWNAEVVHYGLPWLQAPADPSRLPIALGAFLGTFSHLVLDAVIHRDMTPWAPLFGGNPLLGAVGHDVLYSACAVAAGIGAAAWLARKFACRERA